MVWSHGDCFDCGTVDNCLAHVDFTKIYFLPIGADLYLRVINAFRKRDLIAANIPRRSAMATLDPFGVGLLLGFIVSGPVFASARIAIGLLGGIAVSVTPFVLTSGFGAFQHALEEILKALTTDSRLTGGLLFGVAGAGVYSVVFRKFTKWM
jgi:hypothetical protein